MGRSLYAPRLYPCDSIETRELEAVANVYLSKQGRVIGSTQ